MADDWRCEVLDKPLNMRIIENTTEYTTQKAETEESSPAEVDREVRGTD